MTASLRELCNCIGLSGNISIIRDFFGYNSAPEELSLLRQVKLLKLGEHVRLHIKIVTNTISFTIDQMIDAMRLVYGNSGIAVVVGSTETLNLPASFLDINIGACPLPPADVPAEEDQLFQNRNNAGINDVVVYFVRSTIPAKNGCSTYPAGIPSVVIVRTASRWTLAHEVGHVLGLSHSDTSSSCNFNSLMTGCGTSSIPATTTPGLVTSEVTTMNNSPLTNKC